MMRLTRKERRAGREKTWVRETVEESYLQGSKESNQIGQSAAKGGVCEIIPAINCRNLMESLTVNVEGDKG